MDKLRLLWIHLDPHVIYNVLNAIESYMVANDTRAARQAIQQFAQWHRLVVAHSKAEYITVKEEWKALQLYAGLETLRYDHIFTLQFINLVDKPATLHIPSMQVQPQLKLAIQRHIRQCKDKPLDVVMERRDDYICFNLGGQLLEIALSVESNPCNEGCFTKG